MPLSLSHLEALLASCKAVVLGPGLGQSEYAAALVRETLRHCRVPLIADADALNLIARRPSLLALRKSPWIFTPHPGEMSRLTEHEIPEILCETRTIAESYRDHYGVTLCLKTDESIIADAESGKTYRNESGSPALAKAGSGDVLSGIIAGLLCLGMKPGEAAGLRCLPARQSGAGGCGALFPPRDFGARYRGCGSERHANCRIRTIEREVSGFGTAEQKRSACLRENQPCGTLSQYGAHAGQPARRNPNCRSCQGGCLRARCQPWLPRQSSPMSAFSCVATAEEALALRAHGVQSPS